jgi:hypothetical protein
MNVFSRVWVLGGEDNEKDEANNGIKTDECPPSAVISVVKASDKLCQ